MKNSNKSLLLILLIIVTIILGFAIINRFFMQPETSLAKAYAQPQTKMQGVGSGQHIKKIYPKISTLQISGAFNIELKPGPANVLTIYTDENILQTINTGFNNETLTIALNEKIKIADDTPIKIVLESKDVNSVALNGKVQFIADFINANNFNLYTTGDTLAHLAGNIDVLNLSLHGATQINARDLASKSVNLDLHGQTEASVFAKQTLNINATGANKITYFGNPESVVKTTSNNETIVLSGD